MASTSHPDRQILPTNVVPTHYHLSLTPNFDTFKYAGTVSVTLDVEKPTSQIVLNVLELELHSASLKTKSGTLEATGIKIDEEKQEATVQFEKEIDVGKAAATLKITFTGILNDKMAGFYRSSYVDVKTGLKKWLATTQMGMQTFAFVGMLTRRTYGCTTCVSLLGILSCWKVLKLG